MHLNSHWSRRLISRDDLTTANDELHTIGTQFQKVIIHFPITENMLRQKRQQLCTIKYQLKIVEIICTQFVQVYQIRYLSTNTTRHQALRKCQRKPVYLQPLDEARTAVCKSMVTAATKQLATLLPAGHFRILRFPLPPSETNEELFESSLTDGVVFDLEAVLSLFNGSEYSRPTEVGSIDLIVQQTLVVVLQSASGKRVTDELFDCVDLLRHFLCVLRVRSFHFHDQ